MKNKFKFSYGLSLMVLHLFVAGALFAQDTTEQINPLTKNDPTVKGYSWDAQKNKWKARLKVNQRLRHLGYFDTEENAHQAYLVAKRALLRNV